MTASHKSATTMTTTHYNLKHNQQLQAMFINIKSAVAVAFSLVLCCKANRASAQTDLCSADLQRYSMFGAPGRVFTSQALAYKGQFRLDVGFSGYIKGGIKSYLSETEEQASLFAMNHLKRSSEFAFGLYYSPWERVTLGMGGSFSYRHYYDIVRNFDKTVHQFYSISKPEINTNHFVWDFSATFHDWIDGRFAYEARYSLGLNKLISIVKSEVIERSSSIFSDDPTVYYNDDEISGFALRNGIMGGISVFNESRSLQAGAQLHADYVRFLNTDYSILNWMEGRVPWMVQSKLYDYFSQNRNHFRLTPALTLAWHAKYLFSAQLHVGLPIAIINGQMNAPCTTIGFQLSFRLKKWRRTPDIEPTLIERAVKKAGDIIESIEGDV